jgi:GPH family glycoside/pentoside/hexuronide:cation symporter
MSSTNNIKNEEVIDQATTGKMTSYSFTFFVSNFIMVSYGLGIFYFYEVEIGLAVTLVALSNAIFAIWNMFNDPLLGYLTDKPLRWTKKYGLRAPWIVISVIPTIICFFLLFIPPDVDPKTNPWPIFWYMVIMTCLFDTFYSLFQNHFSGGFANQFRSDDERRKASMISQIIGVMGSLATGIVFPLTIIYGDKSSFVLAGFVSLIIMSICVLIFLPGIRESQDTIDRYLKGFKKKNDITFWRMMKIALKKKNFMLSLTAYSLYVLSYTLNQASMIYFIKDILEMDLTVAIYTSISFIVASVLSIPLWVKFAKKFGHVTTYALGLFLMGVAYIPYLWITTLTEAIIFSFTSGIAYGCFNIMIMPIVSDCYDEVTVEVGKHQEATLLGIRNFFFRLTLIFQGFIIAWVHISTAYNPDPLATQTPLAIWGIRVHMALIPSICLFIGSFVIFVWYDLKGEKKIAIRKRLNELGL